jgi:hypothetical protein
VGNVTAYNLTGLADCTRYYIAAKAYDSSGNESTNFSPELSGLPTPTAAASLPSASERGQSLIVSVSGSNYDSSASVSFSDPKISVLSTTFVSCNQLRASISIAPDAALGSDALEVMNTDRSFGVRAGAFQVMDVTVPVVSTTAPSAGATGVTQATQPTITFSEPMDAASVTVATVRLLLPDGTAVAQAAGSPSLDTTSRTARIAPAASLQYQTTYRIQVIGGAGGVRDALGTSLAGAFAQSPGFTTVPAPQPPAVSSTTPADGTVRVDSGVRPTVTFTRPLDPSSVSVWTVELLLLDGTAVAQAVGSPSLDAAGLTATIAPASPLSAGTTYIVRVIGGALGVRDLAATSMAATYTQSAGFQTKATGPGSVTNLRRKDKH